MRYIPKEPHSVTSATGVRPDADGVARAISGFLSTEFGGSIMWYQSIVASMPTCQNCGSFVTTDYVRVFTPNEIDRPRVCPDCEDLVRDGADVREARATRSN